MTNVGTRQSQDPRDKSLGLWPSWIALTDNSGGTASATIADIVGTATALTDNSGGTPGVTIALITNAANAGSADIAPTQDAVASLAALANTLQGQLVVTANAMATIALYINGIGTKLN